MRATHLTAAQAEHLLAIGAPQVHSMGLSIPMAEAASRHPATLRARAYDRVRRHASLLPACAADTAAHFGIAVPSTRVALPPVSAFAGGHSAETLTMLARLLEASAQDAGIDIIDGFGTSRSGSPTDCDVLDALPHVLAHTERLHATLACDASHTSRYLDALGTALSATQTGAERVALSCNAPPHAHDGNARVTVALSFTDVLARVASAPTDRAAFARDIEGHVAGLARVGALFTAHAAMSLSRRSGLPVASGLVVLDAELPVRWDPAGWGPLSTLRLVETAIAEGARRAGARAHLTMRAAPGAGHTLPLELALLRSATYHVSTPPTPSLPAELCAVCAATGHSAHLRFTPPLP